MKIKIVCVGKLKEKYLKDAIAEYAKRLSRFCDFKVIELADEKIPDNPSPAEEARVIEAEAERILKSVSQGDYLISLCVEGAQQSSEEFAKNIRGLCNAGKSSIAFIIGGSLGLSERVKSASMQRLGFSKMTFPHQLMRLILSEQIYRAFKINSNEKYHK